MAKGIKTGGRVAGTPNKATQEFKEALNNLLNFAAPQMVGWLEMVAKEDPNKALDHVGKLAEYVHAKLARTDTTLSSPGGGPIQHEVKVSFIDANPNTDGV